MPEVPPPMRVASSTVTAAPAWASRYATEAPITPAPITIVLIICLSRGSRWIMACDHSAIARGLQDRLDGPTLGQPIAQFVATFPANLLLPLAVSQATKQVTGAQFFIFATER